MSVPIRLLAFAIGLLAVFVVGLALGASVGPDPTPPVHVETHR